jgi:hypothetical protein
MRTLRTIFRSLVLGAGIIGTVGTPAISHATSIFVSIGPPVAPVYVRPLIPAPGYIWVDGYWAWGDEGYYWVPGYWTLPPYAGAIWQPGIWGYGGGGWGWTAGFWAHPAGYFGGVYYSNPWPWYGSFGVCREGWYRNSFYGRNYYNGWYNQRWGNEHGRPFDDHRWQQAQHFEGRYNGNVNHGAFADGRGVNGNRSVENHAVFNGQVQHAGHNPGGSYDHGIRPENRGIGQNQNPGQRPLITADRSQVPAYNRNQVPAYNRGGETFANRPNYQGGQGSSVRPAYTPGMNNYGQRQAMQQTQRGALSGNNVYRPQQSYNGGGQRFSAPQAYGGGQRYSAPQSYGGGQHYSSPQAYGGGSQHYSAPQAQHYSGGGASGGGFHGGDGGGAAHGGGGRGR